MTLIQLDLVFKDGELQMVYHIIPVHMTLIHMYLVLNLEASVEVMEDMVEVMVMEEDMEVSVEAMVEDMEEDIIDLKYSSQNIV
jgi:hypothetical protein